MRLWNTANAEIGFHCDMMNGGATNMAINGGQLTSKQFTLPQCSLCFISGHSLEYSMVPSKEEWIFCSQWVWKLRKVSGKGKSNGISDPTYSISQQNFKLLSSSSLSCPCSLLVYLLHACFLLSNPVIAIMSLCHGSYSMTMYTHLNHGMVNFQWFVETPLNPANREQYETWIVMLLDF